MQRIQCELASLPWATEHDEQGRAGRQVASRSGQCGAQGWSIRDTGSLNGTYVDRKRVNDRLLTGGEEVQIGKFRFIFLVGASSGETDVNG
ncbi:MAG: FHA domain-containing protein [Actinomycetales bacterium]